MGMVKIKRPHVFFLQRSKQSDQTQLVCFFVFLIRCANESPPWLIVWLKSSRHPIPHETSCLRFFFSFFFPGHVNARSNASLVGGDTTLILLRHRELYILRWRKGREHGVLRILHVCNGTSVNTHPRSSSWKLLPPQSSPCLRRNLCAFFFFFFYRRMSVHFFLELYCFHCWTWRGAFQGENINLTDLRG